MDRCIDLGDPQPGAAEFARLPTPEHPGTAVRADQDVAVRLRHDHAPPGPERPVDRTVSGARASRAPAVVCGHSDAVRLLMDGLAAVVRAGSIRGRSTLCATAPIGSAVVGPSPSSSPPSHRPVSCTVEACCAVDADGHRSHRGQQPNSFAVQRLGSIATSSAPMPPSSSGLGRLPFTQVTRVRIPLGVQRQESTTAVGG